MILDYYYYLEGKDIQVCINENEKIIVTAEADPGEGLRGLETPPPPPPPPFEQHSFFDILFDTS